MLHNVVKFDKKFHPFHIVDYSPWPIYLSFSLLLTASGLLSWLNGFNSFLIFISSLLLSSFIVTLWWRDVIRESTFQGKHTIEVMNGLRLGMIMFIISEVMFFFSFFYGLFFLSLSPDSSIGLLYPPCGIENVGFLGIPLLNSILLLSSGVTITWSHYELLSGNLSLSFKSLIITIMLGLVFLVFQYMEYKSSTFSIADSSFGSLFFMMTGFHGIHVCVGVLFIIISTLRLNFYHLNSNHHLGFEMSSWYWHFVDVVWLFLYLTLYWWLS
uniref:Cytochrome c oxidase subunit 3 n=1 Tax=Pediculus schaeffi TaxID=240286 RepID=M4VP63_PEDSC|nr:cytochrome c oxidase subunit 3 [Pediculus schaeffi]